MIKKHTTLELGNLDFYTLKGVIGESKVSRDGKEVFEPVRKFLYGKGKVALSISLVVPTTVDKKHIKIPVDVVCFNESAHKAILKLKLDTGTKVEVLARKTEKGLAIDDPNWITVHKNI